MPGIFDTEILGAIGGIAAPVAIDQQVLTAADHAGAWEAERRQYLRNVYALGLTEPVRAKRLPHVQRALKEVTDPNDRRMLLEEIAKVAREKAQVREAGFAESGFIGRWGRSAIPVGTAFSEAGSGMVEAATGLVEGMLGEHPTQEDVLFGQAMESAFRGEYPTVPEHLSQVPMKIATGIAQFAPDMSAGLLAGQVAGPTGMFGYWAARTYPEAREELIGIGVDPTTAAVAGAASSAAVAAIELFEMDPTGVTKAGTNNLARLSTRAILREANKTLVRMSKETMEEGAQALTEEGIKWIFGELYPGAERMPFAELAAAPGKATMEALPGMAGLAVIGGGARMATSTSLDGAEEMFQFGTDVVKHATANRAPSRRKFAEWGGDSKRHDTAAKRLAATKAYARTIEDVLKTRVLEGFVPTAEQWVRWGFDPKANTEAKRGPAIEQYLKEHYGDLAAGEVQQQKTELAQQGIAGQAAQEAQAGVSEEIEALVQPYGDTAQVVSPAADEAVGVPTAERGVLSTQVEAETEQVAPPEIGAQVPPVAPGRTPTEQALADAQPSDVSGGRLAAPEAPPWGPRGYDSVLSQEQVGPPMGGREMVRKLGKIFQTTIREGMLSIRNARGQYTPGTRVARLARGDEGTPEVAIHEVAHDIEERSNVLKNVPKVAELELMLLDYDPNQGRVSEGFAEFVRGYITGSTSNLKAINLSHHAPNFLQHFEEWMDAEELRSMFDQARTLFQQYSEAGAVGRLAGQISPSGFDLEELKKRQLVARVWENGYMLMKDQGWGVHLFDVEAERLGWTPRMSEEGIPETTAYQDYQAMMKMAPHFAASSIEYGPMLLTGNRDVVGPSLVEVMAEIDTQSQERDQHGYTDEDRFKMFLFARHALEVWEKSEGKMNPGISQVDAQYAYDELHNERYERAAEKFTGYHNALIRVLEDVGRLTPGESQAMREAWQTYIPLWRARRRRWWQAAAKGRVSFGNLLKGRKGSGLQIIDPLTSTLSKAVKVYDQAARQLVTNKLYSMATRTRGMGKWLEDVPQQVEAMTASAQDVLIQIRDELADAGLSEEDVQFIIDEIGPEAAVTLFRPKGFYSGDRNIMRVVINGEPRWVQMSERGDILYDALDGVNSHQTFGLATQLARYLNGLLKIGATRWNPAFWVTNAIKDYHVFLMQGERGLAGAFDPMKYAVAYVYSEVAREAGREGDPVVKLFETMGGELSTYAGLDLASLRSAKKVVERRGRYGYLQTALRIAGTPEVANRLAEFAAVLDKEGWLERAKQGKEPPMPVLIRAINAAHDVTVDFRRLGKWGRFLNAWIPFWNAQLEGKDKMVRTFIDHPQRTLMRIGMNIVPLALIYWWMRHDDDDYKERPAWLDKFWTFTDDKGEPIVRIPKPHEWGLVHSGIERMLDAMYDKDPQAVTRWFNQVLESVVSEPSIVGITPLFESMANYQYFTNRPIVSEALQGLEPQEQYYDNTTKVVKHAAQFLHRISGGTIKLSPAKIDHLINGFTGGFFKNVVAPTEKLIVGEGWGTHDVPLLRGVTMRKEYTKSIDDFYRMKELLRKRVNTLKRTGQEVSPDELQKMYEFDRVARIFAKMRQSLAEPDVPPEVRDAVLRNMTGIARQVLEREPLDRYPGIESSE